MIFSIAAVLAAELFNSAIERLSREVDREHNPNVGAALDSGAVLVTAIGAAAAGSLIFGYRLGVIAGRW